MKFVSVIIGRGKETIDHNTQNIKLWIPISYDADAPICELFMQFDELAHSLLNDACRGGIFSDQILE